MLPFPGGLPLVPMAEAHVYGNMVPHLLLLKRFGQVMTFRYVHFLLKKTKKHDGWIRTPGFALVSNHHNHGAESQARLRKKKQCNNPMEKIKKNVDETKWFSYDKAYLIR